MGHADGGQGMTTHQKDRDIIKIFKKIFQPRREYKVIIHIFIYLFIYDLAAYGILAPSLGIKPMTPRSGSKES